MEGGPASAECVRVVVRCRPLNKVEVSDGRKRAVNMDRQLQQASLKSLRHDAGMLFLHSLSSTPATAGGRVVCCLTFIQHVDLLTH